MVDVVAGASAPAETLAVVVPHLVRRAVPVARRHECALAARLDEPHARIPSRLLPVRLPGLQPRLLPRAERQVVAHGIELAVVAEEVGRAPALERPVRQRQESLHVVRRAVWRDDARVQERLAPVAREREVGGQIPDAPHLRQRAGDVAELDLASGIVEILAIEAGILLDPAVDDVVLLAVHERNHARIAELVHLVLQEVGHHQLARAAPLAFVAFRVVEHEEPPVLRHRLRDEVERLPVVVRRAVDERIGDDPRFGVGPALEELRGLGRVDARQGRSQHQIGNHRSRISRNPQTT